MSHLLHFNKMKLVKDCTITRYYECSVTGCGHRSYTIRGGCYQPIDRQWLAGGDWIEMPPPRSPRR